MTMKSLALVLLGSILPAIAFGQGASPHVTGSILAQKTLFASDKAAQKAVSDNGAKVARSISPMGVYVLSAPGAGVAGPHEKTGAIRVCLLMLTWRAAPRAGPAPTTPDFPANGIWGRSTPPQPGI